MKLQIDEKEFEIKKGSKAERKLNALLRCLEYWSSDQVYLEIMSLQKRIDHLKNKRNTIYISNLESV